MGNTNKFNVNLDLENPDLSKMLFCGLLLRQNRQRPLSVAAGALHNSVASFSTTALLPPPPPPPPPKNWFRDYAKFSTLVGAGAGADHGLGDEKEVVSGGHLDIDEKDLDESDASISVSKETSESDSDSPEVRGRPDVRFYFDEKELESDESIWALYKRWCRHYEHYGMRKRTPEEMQQKFNTFKKNAKMVIKFRKSVSGVMIFLEWYADGDVFPVRLYPYDLSPNDPSWIECRDDDDKLRKLIKKITKGKNRMRKERHARGRGSL